jgi:hypothetical protein
MTTLRLKPSLDNLQQEYVVVQAWKKAHDYVRAHNWYADVLDLDLSNTHLRTTVAALRQELHAWADLRPGPARLVIAPKASRWEVGKGFWRPQAKEKRNLRPLAHLSIRDQTIATAFMLCLADFAETLQGNPEWPLENCRRRGMVSYGHRLLVDELDGNLHYRWANATYYRGYFEDYQSFIRRPERVVRNDFPKATNWAVVQADFSQFYDRVRPIALHQKIERLFSERAQPQFLEAFNGFFNWRWMPGADVKDALDYAKRAEPKPIEGFDTLALPQGLAASGFFANLFLFDFDEAVWSFRSRRRETGWSLVDYCRYVDDLRLVIELPSARKLDSESLGQEVTSWLQSLADKAAPGMVLNPKKTKVLFGRHEASRIALFSDTMKAIQGRVSGTLDLAGGEETLTMIEGLFGSEPEDSPLAKGENPDANSFFAAYKDVKDETVARFSANRFRKTFRMVRPLAPEPGERPRIAWASTKVAIDQRAAHFARRLVWRWVKDPSNVRLLRVALDLNPDPETANRIIDLLHPIVLGGTRGGWVRKVAEYCAAELFKAAATEIGVRVKPDGLPSTANPLKVGAVFADFAQEVFVSRARLPWYLVQQSLLLLAAAGRPVNTAARSTSPAEWTHYLTLHSFLRGRIPVISGSEVVRFTLAASCFDRQEGDSLKRFGKWLATALNSAEVDAAVRVILEEDLGAAERLYLLLSADLKERWSELFLGFGIGQGSRFPKAIPALSQRPKAYSAAEVSRSDLNPFRQEYMALLLLVKLIEKEPETGATITPWSIGIEAKWPDLYPGSPEFLRADFAVLLNPIPGRPSPAYETPDWLARAERWRYRVGQILRSVVVGNLDFTVNARRTDSQGKLGYRPYASHWYRRRYGLYNGRAALGPDWVPVSTWFCSLLTRLLAWPGVPPVQDETGLGSSPVKRAVLKVLRGRIDLLRREFGDSSATPILRQSIRLSALRNGASRNGSAASSLRVAVLQTVLPRSEVLVQDPELLDPGNRIEQLRHFTSALSALDAMLRLRETHTPQDGRLDLLVLPELSIHIDDIDTILVPFARQHRCMVFGGLVYHRLLGGPRSTLVNSAVWLLPTLNALGGLSMDRIRQGKQHLAPNVEENIEGLGGWRPCQHIVQLLEGPLDAALWTFSGSICYDATDLGLASDLRNLTDTWLVPALNKDVNLFDAMVAALHYHMFQHVVVCNNGEFGGSVTQAPFSESFRRTIVHHHGNEQATISFFELDLSFYKRSRANRGIPRARTLLKTRPAGLTR